MICVVIANDQQKEELLSKPLPEGTHLNFTSLQGLLSNAINADLFILLDEEIRLESIKNALKGKPVIINSVVHTLNELNLPSNFHRINAWPGFIKSSAWEIASADIENVKPVLEQLNWDFILVKDQPGLVAARVIAMIINEAWFALEEGVSTKADIDTAMKLGTGYPHGPFEWGNIIGLEKIVALLNKLSVSDKSYVPSKSLSSEEINK